MSVSSQNLLHTLSVKNCHLGNCKRTNRDKRLQGSLWVWPGRACNSYRGQWSSIAIASSAPFSPGWERWSGTPAWTPTAEQPLFSPGMGQVASSHCLSPLSSKRCASCSSTQVDWYMTTSCTLDSLMRTFWDISCPQFKQSYTFFSFLWHWLKCAFPFSRSLFSPKLDSKLSWACSGCCFQNRSPKFSFNMEKKLKNCSALCNRFNTVRNRFNTHHGGVGVLHILPALGASEQHIVIMKKY